MRSVKPSLMAVTGAAALAVMLVLVGFAGTALARGMAGPAASGKLSNGHPPTMGLTLEIYPRGARFEHVLPANFAVEQGVPVRLTFVNHTTRAHTFTVHALGISVLIRAGSKRAPTKTGFTFTPSRFGFFRWYCALPCGGDMSGRIYAILQN